jgi:hypothetical protein
LDAERRVLATEYKTLRHLTIAEIMERYRDEVVPRKRGADRETITTNAFLRQPLAKVAVANLTTGMVSTYCDLRARVDRTLDARRRVWQAHSASPRSVARLFAKSINSEHGAQREERQREGSQR